MPKEQKIKKCHNVANMRRGLSVLTAQGKCNIQSSPYLPENGKSSLNNLYRRSHQTRQVSLGHPDISKAQKTNQLKPPFQSFAEPPAGGTHYLQTLSKSEAFPYSTKSIKQKHMRRPKCTCWRSLKHVSSHPVTPLGPGNSNCLLQTLRRIWKNTAQHSQFLMAHRDIFILLL